MNSDIAIQDTSQSLTFVSDFQDSTVMDIMQYGVVTIEKDAPVFSAATLIVEKQISGLPVTHNGQIVGMLSEKDLLRLFYENEYLPGTVEDYMTRDVKFFNIDDSASDVCTFLAENTFRRVPILNGRTIAGMVTRLNLMKFFRRQIQASNPVQDETTSNEALADEIMRYGLLKVNPEAPLTEAMDLIVNCHVTGLPVVNNDMILKGIVTEKDILTHLCESKVTKIQVQDLMTEDVTVFGPKSSVSEICATLICNSFHRVPIVSKGQLLGIISRADVLKYRCSIFKK